MSESIFNFEAKDKSPDKVCSLLQGRWVFCVLASPHLHISAFQVETNLKLEMLNNGFKDLHPVVLEWGVTMARHWDLSHLRAISQLLLLDGWKSRPEWSSDTGHHRVNIRYTGVRFGVLDSLLGLLEIPIRILYDSFHFHLFSLVEVNQAIK